MPVPKQLDPNRARRTLVARLSGHPGKVGLVDKVRQIATNLGARPYCVDLVFVAWSGNEIGRGDPKEVARFPLVPNPVVQDLTSVTLDPRSAGILPTGAVRLKEVSAGAVTDDLLRGVSLPDGTRRPGAVDFFYELRNDGRNDGRAPTERARYRILGQPFLDAENVQYVVLLERSSADPSRLGTGVP